MAEQIAIIEFLVGPATGPKLDSKLVKALAFRPLCCLIKFTRIVVVTAAVAAELPFVRPQQAFSQAALESIGSLLVLVVKIAGSAFVLARLVG